MTFFLTFKYVTMKGVFYLPLDGVLLREAFEEGCPGDSRSSLWRLLFRKSWDPNGDRGVGEDPG